MRQGVTMIKRFETCSLCNEPYGLDLKIGHCSKCGGSPTNNRENSSLVIGRLRNLNFINSTTKESLSRIFSDLWIGARIGAQCGLVAGKVIFLLSVLGFFISGMFGGLGLLMAVFGVSFFGMIIIVILFMIKMLVSFIVFGAVIGVVVKKMDAGAGLGALCGVIISGLFIIWLRPFTGFFMLIWTIFPLVAGATIGFIVGLAKEKAKTNYV